MTQTATKGGTPASQPTKPWTYYLELTTANKLHTSSETIFLTIFNTPPPVVLAVAQQRNVERQFEDLENTLGANNFLDVFSQGHIPRMGQDVNPQLVGDKPNTPYWTLISGWFWSYVSHSVHWAPHHRMSCRSVWL